jgi:hypothetical protein
MAIETTVHTDEYTVEGDVEPLTVAEDALVVGGTEDGERIHSDDIDDIQIYTDRTNGGFTFLGNAFGVIGLLMSALFIRGVATYGLVVNISTLALSASAFFAFIGLFYYRHLDKETPGDSGKMDVLVVETTGDRHRFVSHDAREEFGYIRDHLKR